MAFIVRSMIHFEFFFFFLCVKSVKSVSTLGVFFF